MAERKTWRDGVLGTLAKRMEEAGGEVMDAWRKRARRRDRVGDVSYHGLQVVHGGLELTVRSLGRLERATQPPHRAARHEPLQPAVEAPAERARRPAAPPPRKRRPEPTGS